MKGTQSMANIRKRGCTKYSTISYFLAALLLPSVLCPGVKAGAGPAAAFPGAEGDRGTSFLLRTVVLATASRYLLLAWQDERGGEKGGGAAGYLVMVWCRQEEKRVRDVWSPSLLPCTSWRCASGFCFLPSLF